MTIYQKRLRELEERTVKFSIAIVQTLGPYSSSPSLKSIVDQVIRSAGSIGANYAEANNASSKADFRSKIYIAKKESGETRYWLRILSELIRNKELAALEQEALELNLIFQKITSSLEMSNGK